MWIGIVIFSEPVTQKPFRGHCPFGSSKNRFALNSSAPSVLSSTLKALPPPSASRPRRGRVVRCCRACWTTGGCCSNRIVQSPRQSARSARSHLRRSGWSTTYHIVDEQLREIRDDLPPGFYRELPKLAEGPLQGYPRVYGLAWAFVAHTDSRFDPEMLRRFVRAYQRVQPLTIGELWAVAITLAGGARGESPAPGGAHRAWTGGAPGGRHGGRPPARSRRPCSRAGGDELCGGSRAPRWRRPSRCSSSSGCAIRTRWSRRLFTGWRNTWRLRAQRPMRSSGVEHQRQAAMNVTVRNVITSMRLMSAFDWAEFFESVSLVDAILWTDNGFAAPDFATRDRYRHAIEELSRGSQHDELEVARRAVFQAKGFRSKAQEASDPAGDRRADPGYYLIANGRVAFEQELGFRMPIKTWLLRAYVDSSDVSVPWNHRDRQRPHPRFVPLQFRRSGSRVRGPAPNRASRSRPGLGSGDRIGQSEVMELLGPRALPRLALRDGVPADLRTLVVVPTLLTGHAQIAEQIERLEVHYLANPDGDLRFALLSDWTDAPQETMPGDDELLAATHRGHRAAEPTPWARPGWGRAISPFPPSARLERERAEVDRVGAQTWEAP